MLHNKSSSFTAQNESFYDFSNNNSLFGVQISRGFIDQINVRGLSKSQYKGHSLEFSSRQSLNLIINNIIKHHRISNVASELGMIKGVG